MAVNKQFGSPTPIIITDASGNTGTSANLPVIDASVGADSAPAPVYATEIGWVDGSGNLQAVSAANPLPVTGGGGGGGGAATIADGADVTQGAIADAAVASDAGGTLSAKLRGLVKILADVWDSVSHRLKVDGSGVTQPVSGTFWQSTQPVSLASAPSTPVTNAGLTNLDVALSTRALESGGNLASIKTNTDKIPSLGQALAANSVPVILPSATVTTLTPPAAITGFALEAGNLAAIKTDVDKIPSQGQALAAASMPVVLPATQIATLTPPAAITGFALEAGNLATIAARTPALGQAAAAASTPVVIASDQTSLPVSISSIGLPANASQETGGNLDVISALLKNMNQLLEAQRQQAALLKAIYLQNAATFGSSGIVDYTQFLDENVTLQ